MRVLVACECSGRVRDAFAALGHDAWSCDIQPSDVGGNHFQCDVRDVLAMDWDLLVAHPECTFLTVSNNGPVTNGCNLYTAEQAAQYRADAIDFFMLMVNAEVEHIAVENPVGIMSTRYRPPDQYIQPWMFGDDASKNTGLWLKNLPRLKPTNPLPGGRTARRANQTASGQNKMPPSDDRKKLRSMTYPGIAQAMATQWSAAIERGIIKQRKLFT